MKHLLNNTEEQFQFEHIEKAQESLKVLWHKFQRQDHDSDNVQHRY